MLEIKNKTPIIIVNVEEKSDVLTVLDVEETDIAFYKTEAQTVGVAVVNVGETVKMKADDGYNRYILLTAPSSGMPLNIVDGQEIPRCALPNVLYFYDQGP